MSILRIALKSIKQRLLTSSLTGLSVALGVMLMVGVLVAYSVIDQSFKQRSIGYNFVVGRQGSDLQLVLSTVYRIGNPPANVPYRYYLYLNQKEPLVKTAVPITMGDSTQQGGFPIVGTLREYFDMEYAPGQSFKFIGQGGFEKSFDAIIGSQVAEENGWRIDDKDTPENEASTFQLVHGGADSSHVHHEKFRVVAILAKTNTANDRTVFIHLNGFYSISGHEVSLAEAQKREKEFFSGEIPEVKDYHPLRGAHLSQKEVTAILVNTIEGGTAEVEFAGRMKKGHTALAANPIQVMSNLMSLWVGKIKNALLFLTGLVIVVSGISIFVSIYNSMSDRKKEIAIMRALGANRRTVFAIILTESIILCFGGALVGGILGHGLIFAFAPYAAESTGLMINPWTFHPLEYVLLPAMVVLASLVGFIPGMTAYRTDVARTLAD